MERKFILTILLVAIFALVNVAADDKEKTTTAAATTTTTEINTTELLPPTTTTEVPKINTTESLPPTTTTEVPKKVNEDETKVIQDKNEITPKSTPTPVKPAFNGVGVRASFGDGPPGSLNGNGDGLGGFVGYGVHTTGGNGQAGASSYAGASSASNGFGGGFSGVGGPGGFGGFPYGFPSHWGPSGFAGPVGSGVVRVGANGGAGVGFHSRSGFVGGPEIAFPSFPAGFGGFWTPSLPRGGPTDPKAPANAGDPKDVTKTVGVEGAEGGVDAVSKSKVPVGVHVRVDEGNPGGFGYPANFGFWGLNHLAPPIGVNGVLRPKDGTRASEGDSPTVVVESKSDGDSPPKVHITQGGFVSPHGVGSFPVFGPEGFGFPRPDFGPSWAAGKAPIDANVKGSPSEPKSVVSTVAIENDGKPIATDPKSQDNDSPKVNAVDPAIHGGYGVPGSYGGFGGFSSAGSFAGPSGYGGFVGPNGFGTFGYPPQVAGRFGVGTDDDTGNGVSIHKTSNGISVTATSTNGTDSSISGTASFSGSDGQGGFTAFAGPGGFSGGFGYPGGFGPHGGFGFENSFGSYGR